MTNIRLNNLQPMLWSIASHPRSTCKRVMICCVSLFR